MTALAKALTAAAGNGLSTQNFVDDLFSTYLYTGNGSTQTITNGIDLAGNGGLVWTKSRSNAYSHALIDTVRGSAYKLASESTAAQINDTGWISGFSSSGYSVGANTETNTNNVTYASWTFRKAPKFFDVVTFTAATGATTTVNHSLGVEPGMIILKDYGASGSWPVYHRSLGGNKYLLLETTNAEATSSGWMTASSTNFSVLDANLVDGHTYVAYLFAHDTDADGIIQAGSFTTDGSGNATVNLGWEPQYFLLKKSSGTGDWWVTDSMRGWTASGSAAGLRPNTSDTEFSVTGGGFGIPTATGVVYNAVLSASTTYIYLAIRRPNKPPTSGTEVFTIDQGSTSSPAFTTSVVPDAVIFRETAGGSAKFCQRLTGTYRLDSTNTDAEVNNSAIAWDNNVFNFYNSGLTTTTYGYFFRRAPGVFDVVCFTGDGSSQNVTHGLGVAPELMIVKSRYRPSSGTTNWVVGGTVFASGDDTIYLNLTNAKSITNIWNSTLPTSTVFTVYGPPSFNESGATYVAYLFATKAGISKCFSFTGNGSTQNIECGFSAGARFVLLKRTDSTGNWLVADTVRGLVSGNDPSLALNSTAAEVTTVDWIDPYNGGFTVVQEGTNNANVNNATYIGLAFA